LVLLVGGITWRVVGRTLAPVEAIRRQVAEISAKELSLRVPEPGTGDEIHKLAETMNTMLGRLEDSVAGQRAFLSDAAHELRSPVAAMRTELDVAASHPEITSWTNLLDHLGTSTRRLERLIEDLLVLATREERGVQHRAEVDLDEIVIRQLQPLRGTNRLKIDVDGLNAARIRGDPEQLERVVANLVDNAERHAASTIVIELHTSDGAAELVIADDGPGIPVAFRDRVFDRFARLDEARDRRRGGAGLGLAIARRIVDDHKGSIELADTDDGARVVVRLPVGGG
jgi:signal transduction histidine kinase